MALTEEHYMRIRKELDECKKPLFFFDDDQDGLCAFLLMYRYKKEGKGIIVKATPRMNEMFARKVKEYDPDKVFVLDIAVLEDEFIEQVDVPIIWVDHHGPFPETAQKKSNIKYFNPKVENPEDNLPTSYLCYRVVRQDLWVATTGCVADWFIPPFMSEFREQYPTLVDKEYDHVGDILYSTKLGEFIRILSFILKGKIEEVNKAIRIMTRLEGPEEILEQTTAQGKFLYKRFKNVNKEFEPLMKEGLEKAEQGEDPIVFRYADDKTSFTSDISNELTYKYPDRVVLVCREKGGVMRCSLRSGTRELPQMLENALSGLNGKGGGHKNACGMNVVVEQFNEFLDKLKAEMEKSR